MFTQGAVTSGEQKQQTADFQACKLEGPRVSYGTPVCAGRRHTCAADQSRFSAGSSKEEPFQARGAAWGKKQGVLGDEVSGVDDWVDLISKGPPL